MARSREEDHGHKRSSSSRHDKVKDSHNDADRQDRHRKYRHGASAKPEKAAPTSSNAKPSAPSATMDALMRMITGKEERTIADRISDPNRPTWEQYKKDNAEKLDLSGTGEKEMLAYRKKLDAAREKALARRDGSKNKKKKWRSSSESDGSSDDDRSAKRKSRKKKKSSRKRRRRESSDSDTSSDSDSDASRHKHKTKKKRKRHSKSRETSPSPVRLSSFLQGADSGGGA